MCGRKTQGGEENRKIWKGVEKRGGSIELYILDEQNIVRKCNISVQNLNL